PFCCWSSACCAALDLLFCSAQPCCAALPLPANLLLISRVSRGCSSDPPRCADSGLRAPDCFLPPTAGSRLPTACFRGNSCTVALPRLPCSRLLCPALLVRAPLFSVRDCCSGSRSLLLTAALLLREFLAMTCPPVFMV